MKPKMMTNCSKRIHIFPSWTGAAAPERKRETCERRKSENECTSSVITLLYSVFLSSIIIPGVVLI
jgi:hypothetical protein